MQSGYVGNEGRLFLLRTREPVPTSVRIFIALTVHIRFADFCDNALMLRHAAQYRTVLYGNATCCNCKGTGLLSMDDRLDNRQVSFPIEIYTDSDNT